MANKGSRLATNQSLNMGDFLVSPNGNYTAIMQNDGNFVVYQGTEGSVIWASRVVPGVGQGPYSAIMQADGNFVVYQGTGRRAIWASGVVPGVGQGPYRAVMQDDGNFVVYQGTGGGTAIWAVNGPRGSSLATNQILNMGAYLTSPNGNYRAIMQADGNFVVYQGTAGGFAVWASGVVRGAGNGPYRAVMQNDGNFVVYQGTGRHAIWAVNDIPYFYGNAGIPRGRSTTEVGHRYINPDSLVFLTVDTTAVPGGEDVALPGVKVNNHGNGWFTVTTARNTNAPSTGVPFGWLVVQPPPKWEEYGPTALSGNCWTVAVDPTDWKVVYSGSSRGGVWKTVDGEQNWAPAWDQPQVGIYRLLVDPITTSKIYALDYYLQVWISLDAGGSWNQLPSSPPSLAQADTRLGAVMMLASDGTLWVGSLGGLAKLPPPLVGSTWSLENPDPFNTACTDVVIGRDGTLYAAIRGSGVYRRLPNQTQWEAINTSDTIVHKPMRLAVGQDTIVLNADLDIYTTHNISTTPWNNLVYRGHWSDGVLNGQGGYALSVAISPTDDNHFLGFGNCGFVTFDGGAHHFPDNVGPNNPGQTTNQDPSYKCGLPGHLAPCDHLAVGQDDHQVVFFNDQCLALATDNGPRFSSDGGRTWAATQIGPSRISLGPPISEFYDLQVSQPDQFGRVLVTGNVQDAGSQSIIGNQFGMPGGGGETGLSVPAAPVNSHDSTYNMPAATFHFYGTDASFGNPNVLFRNVYNVPGPYYVAPAGAGGEVEESFPKRNDEGSASVVNSDGTISSIFPQNIAVIATHPTAFGQILVGLANGDLYRSVAGSQGAQFELLTQSQFGNTSVTSINFVTTSLAYAGYQNGGLVELTDPFGSTFTTRSRSTASTNPAVSVALDSQVSPARLYITHTDGVWALGDDGKTWNDVIGPRTSGLGTQLSGIVIVGMALDPSHRFLYVATGTGYGGTVWRKSLSPGASNAWANFGTGLPDSVPITGLGVAPDQGLFISTVGRGAWWRRDLTG